MLLEHQSQLELKFGGSGAVARPRRALFNDVAELGKVTELGFPLVNKTRPRLAFSFVRRERRAPAGRRCERNVALSPYIWTITITLFFLPTKKPLRYGTRAFEHVALVRNHAYNPIPRSTRIRHSTTHSFDILLMSRSIHLRLSTQLAWLSRLDKIQ